MLGISLGRCGDVTGDGISDLVMGAEEIGFVLFGQTNPTPLSLKDMTVRSPTFFLNLEILWTISPPSLSHTLSLILLSYHFSIQGPKWIFSDPAWRSNYRKRSGGHRWRRHPGPSLWRPSRGACVTESHCPHGLEGRGLRHLWIRTARLPLPPQPVHYPSLSVRSLSFFHPISISLSLSFSLPPFSFHTEALR